MPTLKSSSLQNLLANVRLFDDIAAGQPLDVAEWFRERYEIQAYLG